MSDVQDDDPFGDKAFLEEQRQRRLAGRSALLQGAEDFEDDEPGDDGAGGDAGDDAGGGGGDDGDEGEPKFDHVRIPRLFGTVIRYVAIGMPLDAPVTCLGKMGRTFFYLTPKGELVSLQDSEHGQAHIQGLWSPETDALDQAFPQFDQQRRFKGFQAQYARAAMMKACGKKPLFDPHEKVRGLGCWRTDDDQLVQHLGDRILIGSAEHAPGEIGGYVYPGRPPLLPPKAGGKADCEAIYQRFQLWNFERGEVDARLLLGQLAAGVLGAAIEWRPMAFLTGDAGTGKSTLQRLARALLPKRIISTVDASEAALRALLGQDALMVSFDEIEADAHNDRAQGVMKLARTSASGDDAHRSGQDQVARSFTLRGSFLFSAIVPPAMLQQDMQRFAFLRLKTLKKGAKLPALTSAELRELGQGLVGRITGGWARWERTLHAFFVALQERRHEHRGAMQFGTMLAAAHLLLEDGDPTEADLERWCEPLHRDKLFEYENSAPAWLTIWRTILSSSPDVWRAIGSPTVAQQIKAYYVAASAQDGQDEQRKIRQRLNQVGLTLVRQQKSNRLFLAVAPKHQALAALFRGTQFEAKSGEGPWNIPLRGAPKLEEGGVMKVENVPAFGRQKAPHFWLEGTYEHAGERVPLFDPDEDNYELAPPQDLAGRLEIYSARIRAANSQAELLKLRDQADDLRFEASEQAPELMAAADQAFNERWTELEGGGGAD